MHVLLDFVNHRIKTLQDLIDDWMKKYQTDVSALDAQIKGVNEQILQKKQQSAEIKRKYDAMGKEIAIYREEQRLLAEKREFEMEQCRKATRIQV